MAWIFYRARNGQVNWYMFLGVMLCNYYSWIIHPTSWSTREVSWDSWSSIVAGVSGSKLSRPVDLILAKARLNWPPRSKLVSSSRSSTSSHQTIDLAGLRKKSSPRASNISGWRTTCLQAEVALGPVMFPFPLPLPRPLDDSRQGLGPYQLIQGR